MRSRLNFEGGAEDFLRDLASDGGGWLFVDNLDFYTAAERSTINDLLRAAARVAGFVVIATARARFGLDEGSWLDGDALAALGKAMPVNVEPIDDYELEQLRNAEPRLYALLAPDHPANAVTRNLYLLSRLLRLPEAETRRRTEIEMATNWWKNGGGDPKDGTARARGRVLRDLGERAMRGDITFDVTALDAAALDALIGAEVLSDFGNDRVAFRHDVLREWAITNVIANDTTKIALLPLGVLGSPVQLRGVELAARVVVEEGRNPAAWRQMLETVSGAGSHTVWRRAVILALVHTEVPKQSIALMGDTLLADNAAVLRELIPIMTAVDVRPARDLLIPGVDPEVIPEGFNLPSGPAWPHLIAWVLSQGSSFPLKALPEVVELCISWCSLGLLVPGETLTPLVLRQFNLWLAEIESAIQCVFAPSGFVASPTCSAGSRRIANISIRASPRWTHRSISRSSGGGGTRVQPNTRMCGSSRCGRRAGQSSKPPSIRRLPFSMPGFSCIPTLSICMRSGPASSRRLHACWAFASSPHTTAQISNGTSSAALDAGFCGQARG